MDGTTHTINPGRINGLSSIDTALDAADRGSGDNRARCTVCARHSRGGKLRCGFWDHWVPGANEPLAQLCHEWADKEKVDLTIDFITSQREKLTLTATAESQAISGHDVLQMSD